MLQRIKTIFIGTPSFGIPSLTKLVEDDFFDVISVITQPDKKVGRKQILTLPPIKQEAQKYNVPVLQPHKISDLAEQIKTLTPDLIIVIAYAQIIPQNILDIPKYGIINVHGSLLPKYRGASCIQAAIMNGDTKTGITIMKMDKGLDTGPILSKKTIQISFSDTAGTLFEKLSLLGADLLIQTSRDYILDRIKPIPQDDSRASYVGMLKKTDGHIDWNKPADELEKFIRAMSPWPGSYSNLDEKMSIKILEVKPDSIAIDTFKPGTLFSAKGELLVQCGYDALSIVQLQVSGKNIMTAQEFINGYGRYLEKKIY